MTVSETIAAFLLARDESLISEGVTPHLIEWGRQQIAYGKAAAHSGDCTNQSHSCPRCTYDIAIRDAAALTAALSDQAGGWQDSSTGPKDGTHFLACRGPYYPHWGFDQSPPFVVHYWPVSGEEGFYLSHGIVQDSDNDRPMEFTHWRKPDAPPPSSTAGEG